MIASLMLFGCGVLACLAWMSGLYANAVVATLVALWIAGAALWRQTRLQPLPAEPESSAAMQSIETERRRLQTMLDQAPAPLLTLPADGVLRAANRAARSLFRTDDRITQAPPALHEAIGRIQPGERAVLKLPIGDGDAGAPEPDRSYAVSVANSTGPEGAVRLVLITDIQAELHEAEAAALRDLLQLLSHEIMNSLTPVTSLVESAHALLAGGSPGFVAPGDVQPETVLEVVDALDTILRRARGLDRFVKGYRALARLPPPALRPISVSSLLQDAATLFRTRWPIPLTLDLPEPDLVMRLDDDLIIQALLNLLGNAAEAADAGSLRPPEVTLSAFADGARIAFRVRDSGDGIISGQEETIFQPFFTAKPGGTGIGLGLARQIARTHGGELTLEPSAPGQGASFRLTL